MQYNIIKFYGGNIFFMIILTYMNTYRIKVVISLKDDVKDVRALTIDKMLKNADIEQNANFKTGRFYSFCVSSKDNQSAREKAGRICLEVLSNPVVEKFEICSLELVQ